LEAWRAGGLESSRARGLEGWRWSPTPVLTGPCAA
jgi:hypothetical protein